MFVPIYKNYNIPNKYNMILNDNKDMVILRLKIVLGIFNRW